MSVAAVIVTRGDVDLQRIIGQDWPDAVHEIVVWNNAEEKHDLAVYGRYAAIARTTQPLIFVQDDDVVLPKESLEEIIWQCDSGSAEYGRLVVNMPQIFRHDFYREHALVGWGACFHRDLPEEAFASFWTGVTWGTIPAVGTDFFNRTCDIVFTGLIPYTMVDVAYEALPCSEDATRMWKQRTHMEERQRMLELVKKARDDR